MDLPEITPEAARDFARALMPDVARLLLFLEEQLDRDEERASSGWSRMGDGRWEHTNDGQSVMTPRAALADVAAKRSVVSNARYAYEIAQDEAPRDPSLTDAHSLGYRLGQWHGYHTTLLLLAQMYADHPDFDPSWAPTP